MKEEVKNFVEEYNKRMSWNEDILNSANINHLPVCDIMEGIFRHYISTKKITEEGYDLENAKVYEYTDDDSMKGTLEMQVFSNETCGGIYFWVVSGEDEVAYKKKCKEIIIKKISENITELKSVLNSTMPKLDELTSVYEALR